MIEDKDVLAMIIWKDGQDILEPLRSVVKRYGRHTVTGMVNTTDYHVWFIMKQMGTFEDLIKLYQSLKDRIEPLAKADRPVVVFK